MRAESLPFSLLHCNPRLALPLTVPCAVELTVAALPRRNAAENFRMHVIRDKNNDAAPITTHNKCFFFHIRVEDVYLVVASRQNANAVMCFNFLYALVDIYKSYFDGKFNEKTVLNNFVLIYELLDEVMDFGYPQITNDDMLQLYILSEKLKRKRKKDTSASSASDVTIQATGAVSWCDWRLGGSLLATTAGRLPSCLVPRPCSEASCPMLVSPCSQAGGGHPAQKE